MLLSKLADNFQLLLWRGPVAMVRLKATPRGASPFPERYPEESENAKGRERKSDDLGCRMLSLVDGKGCGSSLLLRSKVVGTLQIGQTEFCCSWHICNILGGVWSHLLFVQSTHKPIARSWSVTQSYRSEACLESHLSMAVPLTYRTN